MAESILFSVAEQLVTKVGSSVFQEIQLIYGVRDELEKFQDSLSTVKALLLDADEEKQKKNHAVENWIRKVEEIVYEADDLVDDLATYDLRKTILKGKLSVKVKDFFSSSNQIWFRYKMGRKINDLTERLNEVKKDALLLNLVGREIVGDRYLPFSMSERETDSYVDKLEVIGREEDKKHMVNQLLDEDCQSDVSTAAIVGFGGLGKTTLAQLVYNDEQVDKHFATKLWICVSEEFDVKLIIKKILNDDRCEVLEELQAKVRAKLQGKKYLLVLDDVWNEDQHKWDNLRKYLLVGAPGSKILVTTRSKIVASVMSVDSPYELEGLEKDKAWELFRKLAFKEGVRHVLNSKLEEIGKAIAKKCKGVPLAIRTLGSLMSTTSEIEWSTILENDIWEQCQSRGDIIPALKLSYDHLPHHLRSCFAYYAMFPKDYVIDKRELVYLWMAQGYIDTLKGDELLEGIGERYLNELIYRSFFQIVDDEFGGSRLKMHDLMHDLARSIAKDSCIAIEKECMGKVSKRVRHVYGSRLGKESMKGVIHQVKGMKTLFMEYRDWDMLTVSLNCQRRLRALNVGMIGPKEMGLTWKLKHLRHLRISRCFLKTLPNSIVNLHNLQTLVLESCTYLEELPRDIQNLINLKSLVIDPCENLKCMPIGLGKLTGLETLSSFMVGSDGEVSWSILEHLNKLRRLSIKRLDNLRNLDSKSKRANLLEKRHLQILELIWKYWDDRKLKIAESELVLDNLQPHPNLQQLKVGKYNGIRFSNWLPRITNLVHLCLVHCENLEKLPPLGQLPVLKTLNLDGLYSLRYISDYDEEVASSSSSSSSSSTTFFPSLQEIHVYSCYKMEGWWRRSRSEVEICQFPRLSRLSIKHCRSLAWLPEGMHQMTSLQELHIERCPWLSERCKKDSGEDWVNISHIPKIVIIDYDYNEEQERERRFLKVRVNKEFR